MPKTAGVSPRMSQRVPNNASFTSAQMISAILFFGVEKKVNSRTKEKVEMRIAVHFGIVSIVA